MCGDKRLVKEFRKRFQREEFLCDYKEWEGTHDSMISAITCPVQEQLREQKVSI